MMAADEQLILVSEANRAIGIGGKTAVHRKGLLHRAFSIFVVDPRGRILLQRRNIKKYHSGGLWANSCCGHPRPDERTLAAAKRRLDEELGVTSPLRFSFSARYRAALDHGMEENEFVYVYFGPLRSAIRPDPAEVSEVEFLSPSEIKRRIQRDPNAYTVWLRHYFHHHRTQIEKAARAARV
jgi:isopentenyl-diphosphate delta-isomerase